MTLCPRAVHCERVRRNFVTGLFVTLPIAAALWIFVGIARAVDQFFPDLLRPKVMGRPLPGIGIVAALVIVMVIGFLARNLLGQKLIELMDHTLTHIPVFGKTYGLLKQIVQAVFGKQQEAFRRVVLVRFPNSNTWSLGFVAGLPTDIEYRLHQKVIAVYVPTTPNPTSGYYLFVPEEETISLDMHVEQALKIVVTMGIAKTESGLIQLAELAKK